MGLQADTTSAHTRKEEGVRPSYEIIRFEQIILFSAAAPLGVIVFFPSLGIHEKASICAALLLFAALGSVCYSLPLTFLSPVMRRTKRENACKGGRGGQREVSPVPAYVFLFISLALGMFGGLLARSFSSDGRLYTGIPKENVETVTGMLTRDGKKLHSGGTLYTVDLFQVGNGDGTTATASGKLVIFSPDTKPRLWGSVIRSNVELVRGEEPAGWIAFGRGETEQRGEHTGRIFSFRNKVKKGLIERIAIMGRPVSGLFQALFLGVRDDVEEEELHIFKESGSMHLLALSGMHLGILTTAIALLIVPLAGKKTGFFLGLGFVGFYIFIVGLKPSLLRAAIMYCLIGLGLLYGRRVKGINVLVASFIVLTLTYSDSVHTLSFQLSFLALFGIMTVGGKLGRRLSSFLPSWIAYPVAASFGAQLATAPLLLNTFGTLYPAGILSSVFLAPLVTLFMWTGLAVLVSPIPWLTAIGVNIQHVLYAGIRYPAELFSQLPHITVFNRTNGEVVIILIICVFLGCFIPIKRIKRIRELQQRQRY